MATTPVFQDVDIHTRDLMGGVTLRVRVIGGRRSARRLWLAGKLCALAAWVGGVKLDLDLIDPSDDPAEHVPTGI